MQTFHCFPSLPPELRRMIWRRAIRDISTPGVIAFNFYTSEPGRRNRQEFVGPPLCSGICHRCSDNASYDWPLGNPSNASVDSGLWQASRESRSVMLDVLSPPGGQKTSNAEPAGARAWWPLTVTEHTRDTLQHITFRLDDLAIVRPAAIETLMEYPKHERFRLPSWRPLQHARRLGIECDSTWRWWLPPRWHARSLITYLFGPRMEAARDPQLTIYFIDYTLRRKVPRLPGSAREEHRGEHSFRGSGGWFVQADPDVWDSGPEGPTIFWASCFVQIGLFKEMADWQAPSNLDDRVIALAWDAD